MMRHDLPPLPALGRRGEAKAWIDWMEAALHAQPRRWAHVRSVWLRAVEFSDRARGRLSNDDLVALELAALLHDVGRAIDPWDTEPHAFVGAGFLDQAGLPRIVRLVAHHSGACAEARERGKEDGCTWHREVSIISDVLTYLDMTTGPDGQVMRPEERRADIAARYGEHSFQVVAFDQIGEEIERGAKVVREWI